MNIICCMIIVIAGVQGQGNPSLNQSRHKREYETIHITIDPQEGRQLIDELFSAAVRGSGRRQNLGFDSSKERDRRNDLGDIYNRQKILRVLGRVRNLGNTLPTNRALPKARSQQGGDELLPSSRKIILNYAKLPGETQKDGRKCIEKAILVDETDFDRGMTCVHRLKSKCHLTYVTDYTSAPQEKCESTFKKNCHISFKPVPHTEKVKVCHAPYVKKCGEGVTGPEICKTIYEDICETQYKTYNIHQEEPNCKEVEEVRCTKEPLDLLHLPQHPARPFATKERCEKWPVKKCQVKVVDVKKIHPQTVCKKIPKEICSPSNCETHPGPKVCHEEVRTQIQQVPNEECDLQPLENCRMESTLLPRLVPKKNCVKIPKEICVNTKSNPQKVKKPVFKNWCYDPRELKKILQDEL